MSNRNTIQPTVAVGLSELSDKLGKISLTSEVRQLLTELGSELRVSFVRGGDKPAIRIVGDNGKDTCTIEEFQALSGYRRFVNEALKDASKISATDKKLEMYGFFLRLAQAVPIVVPARMLEQNATKFNQFGIHIQAINHNLEAIASAIDNDYRKYIIKHAEDTLRILYGAQIACMGPDIVAQDYIEEKLLKYGIPKWIYNKVVDKNFIGNQINDCIVCLFPKNNYLKAISFSTKEMKNEKFLNKNKVVLVKSGPLVTLAKYDFSGLFPPYDKTIAEGVADYLEKYQWTLISPYTADEILAVRESGKNAPIFSEMHGAQKTAKGPKSRPENETVKVTRVIYNMLGKIQHTLNGILNFSVFVSDPKSEFWELIFSGAKDWEITPTNGLYSHIRAQGDLAPLESLRSLATGAPLTRICDIISKTLMIPHGTEHYAIIETAIKSLEDKDFKPTSSKVASITKEFTMIDLNGMIKAPTTDEEKIIASDFLGIRPKERKAQRKTGATAIRATTAVLNVLEPLRGNTIYNQSLSWIMTTFKTGNKGAMQRIAAERILGEALKNKDEIFDEDEYDILQRLEEEENDDE